MTLSKKTPQETESFSPEESSSAESSPSDVQKNREQMTKKENKQSVPKSTRRAIAWSFDPSGPRNVVIRDTPRQKPASSNKDGRTLFATFEAYVLVVLLFLSSRNTQFSIHTTHTHTHRGSESAFSSMSEDITVGDDVSSMMAPSEIFLEQSEWLGPSSEAEEE